MSCLLSAFNGAGPQPRDLRAKPKGKSGFPLFVFVQGLQLLLGLRRLYKRDISRDSTSRNKLAVSMNPGKFCASVRFSFVVSTADLSLRVSSIQRLIVCKKLFWFRVSLSRLGRSLRKGLSHRFGMVYQQAS